MAQGTRRGRWTKRAFDVTIGAVALVPAVPVLAISALAVRLRMGSGIWFLHQRAGLNGRAITVVKLRTMVNDRDLSGRLEPDELRLTALGRFLRSTSLDELPQLFNVLRGEMSIVGPRPLPLAYVERYTIAQRRRLDVKPGITGWAQVNGRNRLSWPEKFELDVWYVDNESFRLDVTILALTVRSVFARRGVSAEGHATMPEFMGES